MRVFILNLLGLALILSEHKVFIQTWRYIDAAIVADTEIHMLYILWGYINVAA